VGEAKYRLLAQQDGGSEERQLSSNDYEQSNLRTKRHARKVMDSAQASGFEGITSLQSLAIYCYNNMLRYFQILIIYYYKSFS
jgi:hypothetical protein